MSADADPYRPPTDDGDAEPRSCPSCGAVMVHGILRSPMSIDWLEDPQRRTLFSRNGERLSAAALSRAAALPGWRCRTCGILILQCDPS